MLTSKLLFSSRIFIIAILILVCTSGISFGQTDSSKTDSIRTSSSPIDTAFATKTKIQIEKADNLYGIKNGEDGYDNKFVGNVQVRSDDIVMTCDSAYLNGRDNKIRAYGNVDIMKGGSSSAKADYVEYVGNTAQAFMRGNVQIFDNGSQLITDNLTYNLRTKVGIYKNGGQLISDGTTVSSDYGKYNGKSKQSYFKGNVFITSAESDIESKELTYNTDSKVIVFLDESTVYSNEAVIETSKGTYYQKSGNAKFSRRTTIETDDQIITANKLTYNKSNGSGKAQGNVIVYDKKENTELYARLVNYNKETGSGNAKGKVKIIDNDENTILYADATDYNKITGYGIAKGHVRYIDTTENIELNAGKAEFNEHNDFLLATIKPYLTTITDNDTILIVADTMISMKSVHDTLLNKRINYKKGSSFLLLHQKQFEVYDDKKNIVCFYNVQVYADSMQAVCDSLIYLQNDSTFKLYKKPVVWSADQQAEGDTIYLYMANDKIERTELRTNSFIFNDTKYPKMYNQVKGRDIDAFFKDNEIQRAVVMGNAESIYYATDESDKFVGLNRAAGARIKMLFENKQVQRIVFYNQPKGTFYPMEKIKEADRFVDGFKWKEELRPKSRDQLRLR